MNMSSVSGRALPKTPTEVIKGLRAWQNPNNGYSVALVHYTADEEVVPLARQAKKLLPAGQWKREYNLDFSSWAGKAAFPEWTPEKHISESLFANPEVPVWRGWDFGWHRPAVVYTQPLSDGGWWVLGELLGQDTELESFVLNEVASYEAKYFPGVKWQDAADIAGKQVTDKSSHTSFTLLYKHGIYPLARKTEYEEGATIIHQKLHNVLINRPGILVHPRCKNIIEGFSGGYRYPEATPANPVPKLPMKDGYFDHLFDALRYVAVNSFSLWERKPKPKPEKSFVDKLIESKRRPTWDSDFGDFY